MALASVLEGISHRMVAVNGINMHVAEKGEGPVVLFVHGFPELWYSWRHQIAGLAARGYRAVAPDLRGYGDSDSPPSKELYTIFHLVGDLVALIDSLGQDQVFVVGHDWGAMVAWHLCLFCPDKVKALVNLSVVYNARNPERKPVPTLRAILGDDFYVCKFQEPGVAEAEFARCQTSLVIKKTLCDLKYDASMLPIEGFEEGFETPLPDWLTDEDINYYASKFDKTGFTGGLNYYRNIDSNWELTTPWTGAQIKVPTKFIIGDKDLMYHFPGTQSHIHHGGFKKDVPLLQEVIIMEGVGHFITQEKADEITEHIYEFIMKF